MVEIKDYYDIAGFNGEFGESYQVVGNCKSIVAGYSNLIQKLSEQGCAHNYMEPATYARGTSQTKNVVYAKTLELWNDAGYNAGNIGSLGEFFYHTTPELESLFNELAAKLQLRNPQGKITVQPPGSCFPVHVDAFLESYSKTYRVNHNKIKRYCIFLSEWQLGQFFGIGKKTLEYWNVGDIITWDNSMPHATANASLHNKLSLNITGEQL